MTAPGTIERVDLTVVYDGEALRDHSMSVRDLAPALLGLADVFQEANETLNPGEPPVTLEIRATDEGSFMVELSVVHQQIVHMLNSPDASALSVLVGLVAGSYGLFSYLRNRFRGNVQEETLPSGTVRITLPDGTVIEFPPEVLLLARQANIRRAAQAVVTPLERDRIDSLELRTPVSPLPVVITTNDLAAITEATSDDQRGPLITDQRYTQVLTVTSPNFQAGNKWRLNDGQATFWVSMEDPTFLAQIDRGEIAFRKNDRMQVEVWLRQWAEDSGDIHTERSVTRVVRHIQRDVTVQDRLPGMDEVRADD